MPMATSMSALLMRILRAATVETIPLPYGRVFRRDAPDQPFVFLDTAYKRSFIDNTLPRGLTAVTYRVRAFRTTAAGEPADFNVSFGRTSAPQDATFNFLPWTRRKAA